MPDSASLFIGQGCAKWSNCLHPMMSQGFGGTFVW
ncbi:hypothetical protein CGRA01v4_01301 [Colletotrichum graminicola]|nr:hypothetical protein CGRA01v4_01301 [Colletotrichum graminicola]